jgi:transcriptional regulator with XRE-family HTH domain
VPRKPTYAVPIEPTAIGQRLREIRTRRQMTQVELARQLGMPQALLSDYERGRLRVHGGLIVALAHALRVSGDEILGLKPPKKNGRSPDRRLLRRLEEIEKLPRGEKQALLKTIDRFLGGARRPRAN